MKCCVKNCLNKYSNENKKTFFGFPNEKKLQKKWLDFCGKSRSSEISRSWKVCEVHFKDDDFIGKYQCDLGISRKLLLKPGAVPSLVAADFNENVGERGRRLADRNRRSFVESLLKDVHYMPENESEIKAEPLSIEPMSNLLDEPVISNTVTTSGSKKKIISTGREDCMIHESDPQVQIKMLENKLKLLQGENDRLIKTIDKNEAIYKHKLSKKNYEIEQLKLALCKSEHRCTSMETHLREIFTEGQISKLQRGDKTKLDSR